MVTCGWLLWLGSMCNHLATAQITLATGKTTLNVSATTIYIFMRKCKKKIQSCLLIWNDQFVGLIGNQTSVKPDPVCLPSKVSFVWIIRALYSQSFSLTAVTLPELLHDWIEANELAHLIRIREMYSLSAVVCRELWLLCERESLFVMQ